jgi:O-antigen ligase
MPFLLVLLVGFLTLSTAFDFDPGPAPGVKIKNLLLYLLVLGLLLRMSLDKSYRIQFPSMPILFGILAGYAIVSYLAAVFVIQYPRYAVMGNGFDLKNSVIDHMLFFLVFFYGIRTRKDGIAVLQALLAACALAHVLAILDALGIAHFGDIEIRSDGRVQGAIGESNQYGAFVVMSLPPMIALAFITRGALRLFWVGAAALTGITLIMTVSRGAFVATFVAFTAGLIMFRRYAPPGRLVLWGFAGVAGLVLVVVAAAALGFGELLYHRLVAGSGGDLGGTSSGRTEIWTTALGVMAQQPISFLTGFGWRAYQSMPFRYAPHNFYLNQWFNLGLVGLTCSVLLLILPARLAKRAIARAVPHVRPVLMAFVVATIAFATATFFVDLYLPWLYFWSLAGIAARLAINELEQTQPNPAPVEAKATESATSHDNFGWKAKPVSHHGAASLAMRTK